MIEIDLFRASGQNLGANIFARTRQIPDRKNSGADKIVKYINVTLFIGKIGKQSL